MWFYLIICRLKLIVFLFLRFSRGRKPQVIVSSKNELSILYYMIPLSIEHGSFWNYYPNVVFDLSSLIDNIHFANTRVLRRKVKDYPIGTS